MKVKSQPVPKGRPREFDIDQALDRALAVFWRKGYEGASLADLTRAMRINRPSLYAAFGNKRTLFHRVIDRYVKGPAAHTREALGEPTARAVVERLLGQTIDMLTDPRHPRGCLVVQGALACGKTADPIRRELASRRSAAESRLRERLERARSEGDLPTGADPSDLARYIATVTQGMAVQAVSGATRGELERIMELALRAWPS